MPGVFPQWQVHGEAVMTDAKQISQLQAQVNACNYFCLVLYEALDAAVKVMLRSDPIYCAENGVNAITDDEWDSNLRVSKIVLNEVFLRSPK